MPLSYATYTGNSGSPQSSFNIPYSYILKDHIKVYYGRDILANTQTALLVNGTDYNFTADNTIQLIGSTLNSGTATGNPHNLANGVVLTLERDTPDSSQIVEFADGSNLIGDNLNNANLQNLFVVQEQQDKNDLSAAKAISSENASNTATTNVATLTASQFNKDGSVPMTGDINANSNKIKNLADPTNAQDGVTKAYLERSGSITSTQIADGTIVNADVNASAAIAQSKLDIANATQSAAGYQSAADKTKLDGIETGATADQTDAEIRSLVESASDSNVFTDQDHSKLDGIEAGATADQTNAEIRAAVEAASDSNVFTDNDHSKLNAIEAGATADQTATEIKTLYESNNNTNPLTDAEKAVIDGVTANTSELNKLDGFTGSVDDLNEVVAGKNVVEQITGSASDSQIPTAQAVNERVVELVTEVGGFVPIANETSFPTDANGTPINPDINDGAGTIVSLKALTNSFSTGSGVTTHTFINGAGSGNNVIINGLPESTTFQAGKGLILETTSTLSTYNYHRLVLDESGVSNADALVSNFNEKYYGPLSSNPATRPSGADRQNGDLYFNNSDGKMKVYNGTHASGTWDDVAAPGNFFINTLSSSSGSGGGSATFNSTATRFTLSNPPLTAQQLLVSINGVIQKPNAGTSPSEGFAISGADIIFASAPPTGSSYFIVTIGSSVNIGTPSDDTVTSAKIVDGSIVNGDISGSAAIASSKLAKPITLLDNERIKIGTNNDLQLFHDSNNSKITHDGAGGLYIGANTFALQRGDHSENYISMAADGAVELYHNGSKKLETAIHGITVTGRANFSDGDSGGVRIGAGDDIQIIHDTLNSYIKNFTGDFFITNNNNAIKIRPNSAEESIVAHENGAVELHFDASKKIETVSYGVKVTGRLAATTSFTGSDGVKIKLGDSDDLQIEHDGNHSYINEQGTGDLFLQSNGGSISLQKYGTTERLANFITDGAVELFHNGSKKLETTSTGTKVTGTLVTDHSLSNRNMLVNGLMRIAQRLDGNDGGSYTLSAGDYRGVDLAIVRSGASSTLTITHPAHGSLQRLGLHNALKVTIASVTSSFSASAYTTVVAHLEGSHIVPTNWGYTEALTCTLSFYVRANVTGTFSGSFGNSGNNRSNAFEYTINSSEVWEYKTITVTGDTTGTWNKNHTLGAKITWSLGHGSNFSTASSNAGSWAGAELMGTDSQTNVCAATGNYWEISGVQFELGSVATPHEHQNFGELLKKCERYYFRSKRYGHNLYAVDTWNTAEGTLSSHKVVGAYDTHYWWPVEMRTNPTVTFYGTDGTVNKHRFEQVGIRNDEFVVPIDTLNTKTKGFFCRISVNSSHTNQSGYYQGTGNAFVRLSLDASSEF